MALSITELVGANSVVSGATLVISGVTFAIGDLIWLAVSADNTGVAGAASLSTTVTDSAGNTWVNRGGLVNRTPGAAADDGTTLGIWTCLATVALVAGTVTVSFAPDTVAKAAIIRRAVGVLPTFHSVGGGASNSGTTWSTGTIAAVPAGYTVVGFVAVEQTSQANATVGSGWSSRQSAQADGGSNAASQSITSQYKTVSVAGDELYEITSGTARDWAANWIIVFDADGTGYVDGAPWMEFNALATPTLATSPSNVIDVDVVAIFEKFDGPLDDHPGHPVDDDGNSVLITAEKGLDISKSKNLEWLARYGVLNDDADYIDRFLLAAEAVLYYRNPMELPNEAGDLEYYDGDDGSFPGMKFGTDSGQSKFHNKVICLDRLTQGLLLFLASSFNTGARATTAQTLIDQLETVALWALDSDDLVKYFRNTANTNQLMRAAVFLHKAGVLLDNADLKAEARTRIEEIFEDHVSVDGVFYEKQSVDGIGFDLTYQGVSGELLGDYLLLLPPGTWRNEVEAMLELMVAKLAEVVDSGTGLYDDIGSTRTEEKVDEREPGAFPVDLDRDINGVRWQYWGWLLSSSTYSALGDKVITAGQRFEHSIKGDRFKDAVRTRLETHRITLGYSEAWEIKDTDNTSVSPGVTRQSKGGHLELVFPGGQTERQYTFGSPGDNLWEEVGQVTLRVVTPRGMNRDDAEVVATEFRNLFRGDRIFFDQSTDIRIKATSPIGDSHDEGGNWVISISLEYQIFNRG